MSSVSSSGKSSERHFNGTTEKARYLCLAIEGTQWKKNVQKVSWMACDHRTESCMASDSPDTDGGLKVSVNCFSCNSLGHKEKPWSWCGSCDCPGHQVLCWTCLKAHYKMPSGQTARKSSGESWPVTGKPFLPSHLLFSSSLCLCEARHGGDQVWGREVRTWRWDRERGHLSVCQEQA